MRPAREAQWIEAAFDFETPGPWPTICSGFVSIVMEASEWKIWTLRTILEHIKGCPDVDSMDPESDISHGLSDVADGEQETFHLDKIYDCAIVGGGQAGLCVAGRCKTLGLSYAMFDKNETAGDNWRNRYEGARRKL